MMMKALILEREIEKILEIFRDEMIIMITLLLLLCTTRTKTHAHTHNNTLLDVNKDSRFFAKTMRW